MSPQDEARMEKSIVDYKRERALFVKPKRRAQPLYIANDWQSKYDALYREMKPREQFGKTFNKRYAA